MRTIRLSHNVVHRAANSVVENAGRSITQKEFEQKFHCKFGTLLDDSEHYHLTFYTDKDASKFLFKWA